MPCRFGFKEDEWFCSWFCGYKGVLDDVLKHEREVHNAEFMEDVRKMGGK